MDASQPPRQPKDLLIRLPCMLVNQTYATSPESHGLSDLIINYICTRRVSTSSSGYRGALIQYTAARPTFEMGNRVSADSSSNPRLELGKQRAVFEKQKPCRVEVGSFVVVVR